MQSSDEPAPFGAIIIPTRHFATLIPYMTVKELIDRLSALPDQGAEVVIDVAERNKPEKFKEYEIDDVVEVAKFARHEVHIKV